MDLRIPDDYPIGSSCPLKPRHKPVHGSILMGLPAGVVAIMMPLMIGVSGQSKTVFPEPIVINEVMAEEMPAEEVQRPAAPEELEVIELPAIETIPAEESVPVLAPDQPVVEPEPAASAQPERTGEDVTGVFLTPTSVGRDDFLIRTIEDTGKADGNALVFDVKGSYVYFDTDAPMAKELGLVRPAYDLPEVLKLARERGFYTIGRYIAVKDAGFTKARPDTMIKHPKTGRTIGYEFIDPENADALQYNREVICALAKSGIDEINLDYIRFSTEQVGALLVYSTAEKSAKVGTFVKMAREAVDECGPNTKLGISSYAIIGWNYEKNVATLGQDVVGFAPYLDIISPMAYPATFAENAYYNPGKDKGSRMYFLVWRTLEGYKELLGDQAHKIRPWIQGYGVTNKNMKDQMQAVYDAGLCGFTVWNADNAYGVTYKAMKGWVRPDSCAR